MTTKPTNTKAKAVITMKVQAGNKIRYHVRFIDAEGNVLARRTFTYTLGKNETEDDIQPRLMKDVKAEWEKIKMKPQSLRMMEIPLE